MMGMFIGLFIGNKKFRNEIDELMARMMGFKKRKQTSGDEAEK